jgi:hypothetical protein
MLLVLEEHHVFWMLVVLLEDMLPFDYYARDLSGILRCLPVCAGGRAGGCGVGGWGLMWVEVMCYFMRDLCRVSQNWSVYQVFVPVSGHA